MKARRNELSYLMITLLIVGLMMINKPSRIWTFTKDLGPITEVTREIAPFDRLQVNAPIQVLLQAGTTTSLRVIAPETTLPWVYTQNKAGTLKISLDPSTDVGDTQVIVTVPALSHIGLNGSGTISGRGVFSFDKMSVENNGSGTLALSLNTEELQLDVTGSGTVILDGTALSAHINVNGSAFVRASELITDDATVVLSGSGRVDIEARDTLQVKMSGSGDVNYKGNPQINSRSSGSGELKPF